MDEAKVDPASVGQAIVPRKVVSPLFDIVNGFFKSMPWRMDCIVRALTWASNRASQINQIDYLAEIILPPS
jgi:hypothetical protein